MGTAVANRSLEDYGQNVRSLYGICAYPTLGDTRAKSSDIKKKTLTQGIVDLTSKIEFGPVVPLTDGCNLTIPTKIAIGSNDHVLQTYKPEVLLRFLQKFQQYGAETEVFEGMNHCFNYKPRDLVPFNRDNPNILVDNIKQFEYNSAD